MLFLHLGDACWDQRSLEDARYCSGAFSFCLLAFQFLPSCWGCSLGFVVTPNPAWVQGCARSW